MRESDSVSFAGLGSRGAKTLALLALAACSANQAVVDDEGPPEWTMQQSWIAAEGSDQVFYGVGTVQGVRNISLARNTAADRARSELAKVFSTYVARLARDYMASTTAGNMDRSSEEQHVQEGLKSFTRQTLSGVTIDKIWRDPNDGVMYARARLSLATMESLLKMSELSPRVVDFVRQNAKKVHQDLEAEEEKADKREGGR